jgi:integrase
MYNPNITWISADQARALVTAADADGGPQALRTAAVIRLLLHNALRVDEACAADVADLGADAGHRVLRVMRKGARKAEVPLTPATGAALDVYLNDRAQRVGPLLATATGGASSPGSPVGAGAAARPRPGRGVPPVERPEQSRLMEVLTNPAPLGGGIRR